MANHEQRQDLVCPLIQTEESTAFCQLHKGQASNVGIAFVGTYRAKHMSNTNVHKLLPGRKL